ncbi:MAG TPA: ATP-binding protein [Planctomycetes bacterium]|nr:ATP-binding protein [Planctomycetota bacterium]
MSEASNRPHEFRLDLPAVHRSVRVARNLVHRFARLEGLGQEEADTLSLITSELLGNVVDHGGGGGAMHEGEADRDIRMELRIALSESDWVLEVTDEGGGDPAELAAQLENCEAFDLEHDRGRGLFLLKSSVDELSVLPSRSGTGITIEARCARR